MSDDSLHAFTCTRVQELLTTGEAEALSQLAQRRLRQHLCSCPQCRARARLLQRFHTALTCGCGSRSAPPPALRQRLHGIQRQTHGPSGPTAVAPARKRWQPLCETALGLATALLIAFAAPRLAPEPSARVLPSSNAHASVPAHIDAFAGLSAMHPLRHRPASLAQLQDSLLFLSATPASQPVDSI